MRFNPLKSIFANRPKPDSEVETFSPHSPRYAYTFQSFYEKPRILILVDNVRATYFLSFHYILKRLHNTESLAFFVIDSAEITRWTRNKSPEDFVSQVIEDVRPSAVIFSRYGVPHGDVLPGLFKARSIATVCHIDDDLLNINSALGEEIQNRQGDPVVLKARQALLEETDLIYASTAVLGDRLTKQFPDQKIFYGDVDALYLDFLLSEDSPAENKTLTFGYMGSKGHQEDLDAIAPDITQILTQYPKTRFEIFGTIDMPEALKAFSKRTKSYKTNPDYAGFLNQLNQLGWAIGLAPLQDTEFNHCKTPTKYVEYTTCSIPTIASSGPVYEQFQPDEQIIIASPDEWTAKISQLIEDPALRQRLVANGKQYCEENFNLFKLEAQVKELMALV